MTCYIIIEPREFHGDGTWSSGTKGRDGYDNHTHSIIRIPFVLLMVRFHWFTHVLPTCIMATTFEISYPIFLCFEGRGLLLSSALLPPADFMSLFGRHGRCT